MSVEESGPTDVLTGLILPHAPAELLFEKQKHETDNHIKVEKAVLIIDLILRNGSFAESRSRQCKLKRGSSVEFGWITA